ncbi:hypothetical protein [Streptomyces gilvosporeus]|uniref:hypothetical protein n=1 Tax=Streptomyces gilvosporeus TaxID=553510 RepID=UPI00131BC66D|nr:hypothetical protein [Streptomyces gilvosporeus]
MGSRNPLIALGIAMSVLVLPGCSQSRPAQPARPTHKIIKHTLYGSDHDAPHQREVLSWTSQDGNGPIDGTYTLQEQATDSASWTTSSEPKSFHGTQHGNEIVVPVGQLGGAADLHSTIRQNGHRLHLSSDLGIETFDLYDSPSAR